MLQTYMHYYGRIYIIYKRAIVPKTERDKNWLVVPTVTRNIQSQQHVRRDKSQCLCQ